MKIEELHTDGNALAGVLQEMFATEMTTAGRTCQSCHNDNPIGAHLLYRSAGFVLRCPSCGDIAACIAVLPDRYAVSLRGTWQMARE
jgi:hypothetical protein